MSEVERIFDRFIDTFADDLIEIARAYVEVELERALSVAQRQQKKQNKVDAKAEKAAARASKKAQRIAAKQQAKVDRQHEREERRAARREEKERIKTARLEEKQQRQVEHDRLKQERLALKQELEAERRRLREATRKRPVKQLPLDFDGLRAPKSRRGATPAGPPQLFVHKRKRDGQIEKLARPEDAPPETKPSETNGNGPVSSRGPASTRTPVTNGAGELHPAE